MSSKAEGNSSGTEITPLTPSFTGSTSTSFSIAPAPLLITVRDTFHRPGSLTPPPYRFDVSGLVGRDTAAMDRLITGTAEYHRREGSTGTDTVVITGGLSAPNYTIYYRPGLLRSTSAEPVIPVIPNPSGLRHPVDVSVPDGGRVLIDGAFRSSTIVDDGSDLQFELTLPVGYGRPELSAGGLSLPAESYELYPSSTVDVDGKYLAILHGVNSPLSIDIRAGNDATPTTKVQLSHAWSSGTALYISTPVANTALAYAADGSLYRTLTLAAGTTVMRFPVGLFIIQIDGMTFKLLFK